ncbi:glucan endo-1,3-beta-glucosidase-like [Curcuma longa]|uniref:glucan endo-1,3-beta-glucosidase-like n=1 Tax=Curcuma longa TaxID=136217 RepID=UPI003D9DFB6A
MPPAIDALNEGKKRDGRIDTSYNEEEMSKNSNEEEIEERLFISFHALFQVMELLPFCSILLFSFLASSVSEAGNVGVNYGRVANNLPPATKVVELLKSNDIGHVKLYDADPSVLRALVGSGIKVVVTVPNELLASVAARLGFALQWVQRKVAAYYPSTQIHSIAVGNEVFVFPRNITNFLVPTMQNVHTALAHLHLDADVKISSPITLTALQNSYPSSSGSFRPELVETVIWSMLEFLRQIGSYLMINAYPFFAYEANSDVISLDYALFRPNSGVVDAGNGLKYYSLFDAQIDAVFVAMSALKYDDIKIVASETGWPSKGDTDAAAEGRVQTSFGCEPLRFQGKEEDEEEVEVRATGGDRESEGEKTSIYQGKYFQEKKKVAGGGG